MSRNSKKFWNWKQHRIRNEDTGEESVERILELYGTISETTWFEDDITPKMFKDELFSASGPVTVYINSPGGDCIAASQIYTMLTDYKDDVTVKIDGIAASAASVIAMAGNKVLMAPTALIMIHNPATLAYGDKSDMKKAMEMLDEVKESIINAYELKTGLSRDKISHLMDLETWMNAKRAMDLGFADDMLENKEIPEEGFEFSDRAVSITLLNKLREKEPAPVETAEDETEEITGRSVDHLKERLEIIKHYI